MNQRIKMIRKLTKLTQREFGKKIGVGDTAISKIELGEHNPSEQTVKSICREFNVSDVWIKTGEGEMFLNNNKEMHERLDKIMASDHSMHKEIVKFILNLNDESIQNFENIFSFFTNKKD